MRTEGPSGGPVSSAGSLRARNLMMRSDLRCKPSNFSHFLTSHVYSARLNILHIILVSMNPPTRWDWRHMTPSPGMRSAIIWSISFLRNLPQIHIEACAIRQTTAPILRQNLESVCVQHASAAGLRQLGAAIAQCCRKTCPGHWAVNMETLRSHLILTAVADLRHPYDAET